MSIKNKIKALLLRKRPLFRLSWRYGLPCDDYIKLHRWVMLRSLQKKPFLLVSFIYSLICWYVCWFWVAAYRSFLQFNQQAVDDGTSMFSQIFGLFRAGLGQGISAFDYYRFKLYQTSSMLWWQYVFDFQLPFFHSTYQLNAISPTSQAFLSNKLTFAQRLSKAGGQTVATLDSVNLNDNWAVEAWLSLSDNVFIKPESASRSIGCLSLTKLDKNWQFDYLGKQYYGDEGLNSVKALLPVCKYIVQPLLSHHSEMSAWQDSDKTITLRVVSCLEQGKCHLVIGNLELNDDSHRRFNVFAIDVSNGSVILDQDYCAKVMGVDLTTRVTIPFWQSVVDEITLAHSLCADIHTVGWDLVITDTEVVLLEGNINWGVNPLQYAAQAPLLPLLISQSSQFAVTPTKASTVDLR